MAPTKAKQWILTRRPKALPTYGGDDTDFKLVTRDLPALKDDQVLVKLLYLSNDPAQRVWTMGAERSYAEPVKLDGPMYAGGIGEIVDSKVENLKPGTLVRGQINWTEYNVMDAKAVIPLPPIPEGINLSHFLGALGGTGLTAYYGLVVIGEAKKGQRLVVSGAAGATGSMVVQIAKHIVGCSEVIGMAGTDEKCRWVESLGADKCLNYKSKTFEEDLTKATDGYIDLYFDNVGGHILDLMLNRMKQGGVIVACGGISAYNSQEPTILKNYMTVVMMRLSIRGFIVTDFLGKAKETVAMFIQAVQDGKLKIGDEQETVVPTRFEDIPKTWLRLFEGSNQGKLVTKVEEE